MSVGTRSEGDTSTAERQPQHSYGAWKLKLILLTGNSSPRGKMRPANCKQWHDSGTWVPLLATLSEAEPSYSSRVRGSLFLWLFDLLWQAFFFASGALVGV